MRRSREQQLAELKAKIEEDGRRGKARDLAKALVPTLARRDYETAHKLALDLAELTGLLLGNAGPADTLGNVEEAADGIPY